MRALVQDVRYALRMWRKEPSLTAVLVVTLALGIGANAAVFSVVKGTVWEPVPYQQPDQLVSFSTTDTRYEGNDNLGVSIAEFFDWHERCTSYVDIGIHYRYGYNLTGGDRPERVEVIRATASLLPVLGVDAALGRVFGPEEDCPTAQRVALLSDSFWHRYFSGDPKVLGRTIQLESTPYTVLGVLPRNLEREWGRFDLWAPLRADPAKASRGGVGWVPVARLRDDVNLAQAQHEMDAVNAHLAEMYPKLNQHTVTLMPFMDSRFQARDEAAMLILAAAVGFVLLIACVNVANLHLAKAGARRGEFAVRAALGAGRWQLVRQMMIEAAVLALAGGGLGVLAATWGVDVVVATFSEELSAYEIGIDLPALGFTLVVSLVTALLFGLAPALTASNVDVSEGLKSGVTSVSPARTRRGGRDLLLVGQVAMAFAMVVSAGLLIKSFIALLNVDPGFKTGQLLTMEVTVDRNKYPGNYKKRVEFFDAVIQRVRQVPVVSAAAAAFVTPLVNNDNAYGVVVEDYSGPDGSPEIMVPMVIVTPGYFETMGIPLLRGRYLNEGDVYGTLDAVILSKKAAEHFWPGRDAVGRKIRMGWTNGGQPSMTVVGVVGDVKQHGLRPAHPIQIYQTMAQGGSYESHMTIVARTKSDPLASATAVREAVWEVDPDQPAFHIRSVADIVSENTRELSALAMLLSALAVVGLVLAAVGLYGVMSYVVSRRTHEIGIRIALGARPRNVLHLVMKRSAVVTLIGVVSGMVLALMLARALKAALYGVSAADLTTFTGVTVLLITVLLLASYIPARRATKVDPMVALRYE